MKIQDTAMLQWKTKSKGRDKMKTRKTRFLCLLLSLVMVFSAVSGSLTALAAEPDTANAIDYFVEPDYTAKPMARMWFPDASSGEDDNDTIAKQINELAATGFGGVEVTILADSCNYTNEQAAKYGWGSESHVKMLKKIYKAANAVEGGFLVDVTITGHWPANINTIDPNDDAASQEISYTLTKVTAEEVAAGKLNVTLPETKTEDKGTEFGENPELKKGPFIFTDTLVNAVAVQVASIEEKEESSGGGFPGGGFPGGDFPGAPFSLNSTEETKTYNYYNLDFASVKVLDAQPTGEGHKAGVPDKATAEELGVDYAIVEEIYGKEPTTERVGNEKLDENLNRYRMADWQDYYAADISELGLTASEGEDIQVGDWIIIATFCRGTGQLTSGGNDTLMANRIYTVNYFDESGMNAVTDYWNTYILDDELRALIAENKGTGIFEDSIEVSKNTAMWTHDLLEEAVEYYGEDYAYADLIPAIVTLGCESKYGFSNDEAGLVDRIKQDYNDLMGNLYEDDHCKLANEWCHSFGASFRAQTYSLTGLDVAGASATVNIPEGDNSTKGDGLRLLSAAVNLYDKKYLSMEAITASQEYEMNWETVLFELVSNFSWGVNRAIYHGTPYSKSLNGYVADWPGWDAFGKAPLIFGEAYSYREPYFQEMYMVNNYVARIQALLQYGTQKADVVVVRDGTTVSNLGSGNSFQTLLDNGYSYNLMSEALLLGENAQKISNGMIYEDGPGYRAVILNSVTTMSPDALDTILKYAEAGIPVVCVNSNAAKVYGTEKEGYTDAIVAEKFAQLLTYDCVSQVESVDAVLGALQAANITPSASYNISNLETSHYYDETDGSAYYYLYNTGGKTISPSGTSGKTYKELDSGDLKDVVVTLQGEGTPYILDAMTGDITQATQYTVNEDGTVSVHVGDINSGNAAIVALSNNYEDFPAPGAYVELPEEFENYDIIRNDDGTLALRSAEAGLYTLTMAGGKKVNVKVGADKAPVELTNWSLVMESYGPMYDDASEMVDENGIQTVDPSETVITSHDFGKVTLGDWKDLPADEALLEKLGVTSMEHVSGKGYYTTTFDWDGSDAYLNIFYGHDQLTGLTVNGQVIDPLNNMVDYVDLSGYLVEGENTITIEITTTLADRAFVESDTFAKARRCTNRNGLFSVNLAAYEDVVFCGKDVTVDLTGADAAVLSDDLVYTVSVSGAEELATATIAVAIPVQPEVELADGWFSVAQTYVDGVLTVVASNQTGVTGDAEILTLIAENPGVVGDFTVTLTEATLSAYLGNSETFVNVVPGNDTVTTAVDYSNFDVNCDGSVDQLDITRAQRLYGQSGDDLGRADVNHNGEVNVDDLILILNNYS